MSVEVSQYEGVRRHHQMIQRWIVSSYARACWGYVDVGNDQVCVSQLGCNSQLPNEDLLEYLVKFIDL